MNTTRNRIILAAVALVLVAGAWYVGRMQRPAGDEKMEAGNTKGAVTQQGTGTTPSGSTSATSAMEHTQVAQGDESVVVKDQAAGDTVAVQSVSLSQAGWVAVRDSDGRVLGAAWFPEGSHTGVSVPLLRATSAGQRYQVLLYGDDGDHAYDLHKDTVLVDQSGNVVGTTFTAQ